MTKPATILLVEDNRMDIELTLNTFREARMANTVRVATSGEEAMDYLQGQGEYSNRGSYPLPDLILLDLKLPGIDGFEVLKQIKALNRINKIPVVILTVSQEDGDRAISYDLGASSYLVKPVTFESFLNVIKDVGEYWIVLNVRPDK